MSESYFIKYTPQESLPQDQVDLRVLGESLIGFSRLASEFSNVLGIRGEITLSATHTKEGSLIVQSAIDLTTVGPEIFDSAQALYEFLKLTNKAAWSSAVEGLGKIHDGYESLEEYYAKHPIQLLAIASAITILFKKAQKRKEKPSLDESDLPPKIAEHLYALLKTKAFKAFLTPIIQDAVQSIEVSQHEDFRDAAKVDQNTLKDYLPEDEQILPHLEPESEHSLEGEVTSMKSTRGDSLTFHYESGGKGFNLDLLPAHGETTKAYTGFYKERIVTKVVVIRDSMFKKPKLRIQTIEHQAPYLKIDDDEDDRYVVQTGV